jgi:hypothetical protein
MNSVETPVAIAECDICRRGGNASAMAHADGVRCRPAASEQAEFLRNASWPQARS